MCIQFRIVFAEALDSELLTAQCHQHKLPSEVRMQSDILQNSLGNVCILRIDRNTAAIGMIDRDHIVHIGIFRKKFPFDFLNCGIQHTCDTLHGRIDCKNISCAAITAIGIFIAHPCFDRRFRKIRDNVCCEFHMIHIRRFRQIEHKLIDPVTFGDRFLRIAEHNTIPDHFTAFGNIRQGCLMCLRNVRIRNDTGPDLRSFRCIVDRDCHIIFVSQFYAKLRHICIPPLSLFYIRYCPFEIRILLRISI